MSGGAPIATAWVVTVEPYHENSTVEAVFLTEDRAVAYVKKYGKRGSGGVIWKSRRNDEEYYISEVALDP